MRWYGVNRSRQRGLTLIELMVSVTLMAVLVGVGVPAYDRITTSNRLITEINELVSAIHYARSEAIKRGAAVRICVANDDFDGCRGNGDWGNGWIVEVLGGAVLRRHNGPNPDDELVDIGAPTNDGQVAFDRNGFTVDARTVRLCGPDRIDQEAKAFIVTPVGQIRLAGDTNGNGIVEDAAGNDVAC